jgi:GNAT superfamily N-acetyltransferase
MRDLCAHDRLPWRPAPAKRALLGLLRDRRAGRAYVIEAAGVPLGYAVLTRGYSLESLGRDAFVDELYLDPRARGLGFGRAAIRFLLAAARRFGVRALHLEVERRNVAARRVYRRAGFVDHDRFPMTRFPR